MPPPRCILAEWQLFRTRLVRTRLGVWLVLLTGGLVALHIRGDPDRVMMLAVRVGMLAAVLGVAYGAGGETDRAALALTLTHPPTAFAVALGRWLGAVTLAAGVTVAGVVAGVAVAGGGQVGSGLHSIHAVIAGVAAAGAVAGAALPGVWLWGNPVAGGLFLYIAFASSLAPADIRVPSFSALSYVGSAILECLPGVWRYRALGTGGFIPWLHAAVWSAVGVTLAALVVERTRR